MARFLLVLVLSSVCVLGADWRRYVHEQCEVLSAAGEDAGQDALNELVQVHGALGRILGRADLEFVWPLRLVLFDSQREAQRHKPGEWRLGRDAWMLATSPGERLPHAQIVRILLDDNTLRMPEEVERGLIELFSSVVVDGTQVRIGAPPPPERRDLGWARIHLLVVSPEYGSRSRVLFANLQQGADWQAAYKNAFQSTPEEMNSEVEQYLARGQFGTREVTGATVSTRRLSARDFEPVYAETVVADLLEGDAAAAAYQQILDTHGENADALEGLGRYGEALRAGSRSARCYVEFGRARGDSQLAREAYQRAAELNPRWAEPWEMLASISPTRAQQITNLRRAARLEPRNAEYWAELAKLFTAANDFTEAGRAWGGAMRAAESKEERERYYQQRLALETERSERYTSEVLDRAEERRIEQQRLREEWREMVERTQQPADPNDPDGPERAPDVVEWWDDPREKEKVWGVLEKVDCLGAVARLVVRQADETRVQVLVREPEKLVIVGSGDQQATTLGCGVQSPERPVAVEYYVNADSKWKTAGEAALVEFR